MTEPVLEILVGDCRERLSGLAAESVQCCVTSPPYWGLRDYGVGGQIGLEESPEAWVAEMVAVFREVRRVLRADGTLWCNVGDAYANHPASAVNRNGLSGTLNEGRADFPVRQANLGHRQSMGHGLKPKNLLGLPWMLAFALRADGWYLRSDIIWSKPNPMPESVTDRPTKSHEHVFLLSKGPRYFWDAEAVRERSSGQQGAAAEFFRPNAKKGRRGADHKPSGGEAGLTGRRDTGARNIRDVWTITTEAFPGAHFATYPTKLVEPCISAGTPERGCCGACGAPWRRVVERVSTGKSYATGKSQAKRDADLRTGFSGYDDGSRAPVFKTKGWEPGCECEGAEVVPALVLDPFCGAGTTGLVARRLGRRFVGCELNPEYAAMAKKRIQGDMPLFSRGTDW